MDPEVLAIHLPGPSFTALSSKYTPEEIIITLYDNEKYEFVAVVLSGFDERSQVICMICDNSDTLLVALTKYAASERVLGDKRAAFEELSTQPTNKRVDALESVKGKFRDGYTLRDIVQMGGYLLKETGINIQVVWDFLDDFGLGGDSDIVLSRGNGHNVLYLDTIGICIWLIDGEGEPSDIIDSWDEFVDASQARRVVGTLSYAAKKSVYSHNWYIKRKD